MAVIQGCGIKQAHTQEPLKGRGTDRLVAGAEQAAAAADRMTFYEVVMLDLLVFYL